MIANIRSFILNEVEKCLANARRIFPLYANAHAPTIEFYQKGRSGGLAYGSRKIAFNDYILAQMPLDQLINTVSHEIAHIVCSYTGMGRNHDAGWKRCHRMLGGDGKRCYAGEDIQMQMIRTQRKYQHRASCGTVINVSTIMHKRIMGGQVRTLSRTGGRLDQATFTGMVF